MCALNNFSVTRMQLENWALPGLTRFVIVSFLENMKESSGAATLPNHEPQPRSHARWNEWRRKDNCLEGAAQGPGEMGEGGRSGACDQCQGNEQGRPVWSARPQHQRMDRRTLHVCHQKVSACGNFIPFP